MNNIMSNAEVEKSFSNSKITITDRQQTLISGVEKIFEASETKMLMRVAGSNMIMLGQQLSISKLDVDAGMLEVNGRVDELKYTEIKEKTNLIKKIFK